MVIIWYAYMAIGLDLIGQAAKTSLQRIIQVLGTIQQWIGWTDVLEPTINSAQMAVVVLLPIAE